MSRKYINSQDACEILGISRRTLYRLLSEGKISSQKLGRSWRFDEAKLKALMAVRSTGNGEESLRLRSQSESRILFDQLYGRNLKRFILGLLEKIRPDVIVVEDREAMRLIECLELLPSAYAGRIYTMSALRHRSSQEIKKVVYGTVLLFDEVAERAKSLALHRKFLEQHGARVWSVVLAVRKSQLDKSRFKEYDILRCFDFSDADFRRFSASLSLMLLESGVCLDVDHLVIGIKLQQNKIHRIKSLCSKLGRFYQTGVFLSDKFLDSWTLDDPRFIRFSFAILERLKFDGVSKLRFTYDAETQTLNIAVIFAPSMTLDISRPYESLLAMFGPRAKEILPLDYKDMKPALQAKYVYEACLLLLCADICRQFLQILQGEKILGRSRADVSICEKHVFSCFDETLDASLLSAARAIMEGTPLDGDYYLFPSEPPPYIRHIPILSSERSVFVGIYDAMNVVVGSVQDEVRKLQLAQTINEEYAINLEVLQREVLLKAPWMDYQGISQSLDISLDLALLKPKNKIAAISDEIFFCSRGYLLSERSGKKEDPDSKSGFIDSKSQTMMHHRSVQSRVIVERVVCLLQNQLNQPSGIPEFTVNKFLSNIKADWYSISGQKFPISILPFRYAGFARFPQPLSSPNEYVSLRAVVEDSSVLEYDHKNRLVRFLDIEESREYVENQSTEYLEYPEITQLDALVEGYRHILGEIDKDNTRRPNGLLSVSIGRDQKSAYEYVLVETKIWIDDIYKIVTDISAMAILKARKKGIPKEVYNRLSKNMAKAETAPNEILRKYRLMKGLPILLDRISALKFPKSSFKQRMLSRFTALDPEDTDGAFPIKKVVNMASLINGFNDLCNSIFRAFSSSVSKTRVLNEVEESSRAIVRTLPAIRIEVTKLYKALKTSSWDSIGSILNESLEKVLIHGLGRLPDPARNEYEDTERLRQLLSEIQDLLHTAISRYPDRDLAVAFVDILGFLDTADNMVARGEFSNVDEARVFLRQSVAIGIEDCSKKYSNDFLVPPIAVGGDGWLFVFKSAETCTSIIIELMYNLRHLQVRQMPMVGLSWGKPLLTTGGGLDRASVLAFFLTERKKRHRRYPGQIVASDNFISELKKENSCSIGDFRVVGDKKGYRFPGYDGQAILIYEYRWIK